MNERGRDSSRGRLQLAIILCVNHYTPKPPGDLHSTHEIDEPDINYSSLSVMQWDSWLITVMFFFTNSKLTPSNTCQWMHLNVSIQPFSTPTLSHTHADWWNVGHLLCTNLKKCTSKKDPAAPSDTQTNCCIQKDAVSYSNQWQIKWETPQKRIHYKPVDQRQCCFPPSSKSLELSLKVFTLFFQTIFLYLCYDNGGGGSPNSHTGV